jgi:hydrogenase 3 maturation protease
LVESLKSLFEQKGKKILFVGIGNVLRSDDGVGVYICSKIHKSPYLDTLIVEVSIENYIKKINDLDPDILVLIDCADLNRAPGYAEMLPVAKVKDFTQGTHNISLKRVSEFFKMKVLVLGVQPGLLSIGEELTSQVKKSADRIVNDINRFSDYKTWK